MRPSGSFDPLLSCVGDSARSDFAALSVMLRYSEASGPDLPSQPDVSEYFSVTFPLLPFQLLMTSFRLFLHHQFHHKPLGPIGRGSELLMYDPPAAIFKMRHRARLTRIRIIQ